MAAHQFMAAHEFMAAPQMAAHQSDAVLAELAQQLPRTASRHLADHPRLWLPMLAMFTADVAELLYSYGPDIERSRLGLDYLHSTLLETAALALLIALQVDQHRAQLPPVCDLLCDDHDHTKDDHDHAEEVVTP
jgi:hypothetical protein